VPLLGPALLTMAIAQLFDLATFVTMVRRVGPGAEINPIVSAVFATGGVEAVVVAKVALVVLVGAVAIALVSGRDRGMRQAARILVGCAIAAGVFGGWTNAITLGSI
jgi:hypothetical protein